MGGVLFEQLQNQAFADEFSTIGGGSGEPPPTVYFHYGRGDLETPHSRSTLTLREEDGEGTAAEAK